jgi:aspartokinase
MAEKIPMEGVKVVGKLVRLNVENTFLREEVMAEFLRGLARHRINMNLFIGREEEEGIQFSCCVAAPDESRVRKLTGSMPDLKESTQFHASVDLLSVFPHQFNLKVLGLGLMALTRAQIPLYGFCSSFSALTFITEHTHSEKALAVLGDCFEFPAGSSRVSC